MMRTVLTGIACVALAACGTNSPESDGRTTTTGITAAETTTTSPAQTLTTTPTPTVLRYPSSDPVIAGYPLVVHADSIDSRVASWFQGKLVDGQVVALAPGVYTPFNPVIKNLADYLSGPVEGDCLVREKFFPAAGGACWNGVQSGSAEPPQ